MSLLCPIMSRPVTLQLNERRYDDWPQLFEVACKESDCALWIDTTTRYGGPSGYCAFQATGGN